MPPEIVIPTVLHPCVSQPCSQSLAMLRRKSARFNVLGDDHDPSKLKYPDPPVHQRRSICSPVRDRGGTGDIDIGGSNDMHPRQFCVQ